jgi:hypothetical protein
MPTSNYQADVVVEIAWDSGFRTPAADYTWTDVSQYVELAEGITISGGRQDERSQADANQLSLVLDNSDGRFTAGRSSSPYYPNVKLDRPIRVLATPVDGAEQTLFTGYVNEWPVEWDGTDAYARTTVTASSRLSRLGLRAEMRSIVEEAILADSPSAYYTLGEPADSTRANDSSGNGADPLTLAGDSSLPVVFGNAIGPGTDGLTAAEFAGGQYLARQLDVTTSEVTFETFFRVEASAGASVLFSLTYASGGTVIVSLNASGFIVAELWNGSFTTMTGAISLFDETHHVALSVNGANWTVYVDGVATAPTAVGFLLTGAYTLQLGHSSAAASSGATSLTGVLAHWAMFDAALTTQIAFQSVWGLTGFAGDTTDARLERYADLAGIPSAEVDAETGQTTMAHVDTTGQQIVEMLRKVETTEGGVLYDERDGTLTLHNRAHRYVVSSSFTLNMAEQEVEADYTPKYDRTGLLNDVTATNVGSTVTARKSDTDSIDDYGLAAGTIETASDDPDQPLNLASWLVYKNATPRERVPSLTVDALAQVGKTPNCSAVLAATLGDKITVSNRPTQAAASSVDYFIEGWTYVIGPESFTVTWNLSPSSPEDQVLVIGDATRGVIGTNPIGF